MPIDECPKIRGDDKIEYGAITRIMAGIPIVCIDRADHEKPLMKQ
jgi:hypothetical protein